MNLFVAASGSRAAALTVSIESAIRSAAAPFPVLANREAEIHRSIDGSVVLVTLAPAPSVVAPRLYTSSDAHGVVTFDGLPLSPSGRHAWDSRELARRYEVLGDELEGAFAIVRLLAAAEQLEVLTDPLGNLPVFWTTLDDGTHLLGNSLAAVAEVAQATHLDPVGVSTFLTLGWYGEGRTPLLRISVLPGGSRISFERDGRVVVDRHFGPQQLLLENAPPTLADLRRDLEGLVRSAALPDGADLGLTAGRDSRVCLALALAAGVEVRTFTEGRPGMFDVDAAAEVSRRFGVPHRVLEPPEVGHFDIEKVIRSFVAQGDCASSFGQLADHFQQLEAPRRLPAKVLGLGGEVARANTHPVRAFLVAGRPLADFAVTQRWLTVKKTALFDGLVKADCREATARYVDRWFAARRDEGFSPRWLAESLYVFDAMIRVHNGSVRRTAGTADLVVPLSSRPFLRFAWSRSPAQRYAESTHFALLELMDPRMLEPPLDHPWPAQKLRFTSVRASYNLFARAVEGRTPRGNAPALESPFWAAQRDLHRELVGSLEDSPLFSFVERAVLRRALEPGVLPSPGAMRALSILWWLHGR